MMFDDDHNFVIYIIMAASLAAVGGFGSFTVAQTRKPEYGEEKKKITQHIHNTTRYAHSYAHERVHSIARKSAVLACVVV